MSTHWPELHVDVSSTVYSVLLQWTVRLLDVSTTQGPKLHLDMSRQQEPLLLLDLSALQENELHLNVPRQQKPLMLLDF
jgi:hypothetical protein